MFCKMKNSYSTSCDAEHSVDADIMGAVAVNLRGKASKVDGFLD